MPTNNDNYVINTFYIFLSFSSPGGAFLERDEDEEEEEAHHEELLRAIGEIGTSWADGLEAINATVRGLEAKFARLEESMELLNKTTQTLVSTTEGIETKVCKLQTSLNETVQGVDDKVGEIQTWLNETADEVSSSTASAQTSTQSWIVHQLLDPHIFLHRSETALANGSLPSSF